MKASDDALDGVDGASANLDLPIRARRDRLAPLDPGEKRPLVSENPVDPKDVGDEVVGEDRQAIEVVESTWAGPFERKCQIGSEDLSSLVERDGSPAIAGDIAEEGLRGEEIEKSCGGVPGDLEEPVEAAAEARNQVGTEIVPSTREQLHQLPDRPGGTFILAEEPSAVLGGDVREIIR